MPELLLLSSVNMLSMYFYNICGNVLYLGYHRKITFLIMILVLLGVKFEKGSDEGWKRVFSRKVIVELGEKGLVRGIWLVTEQTLEVLLQSWRRG